MYSHATIWQYYIHQVLGNIMTTAKKISADCNASQDTASYYRPKSLPEILILLSVNIPELPGSTEKLQSCSSLHQGVQVSGTVQQ